MLINFFALSQTDSSAFKIFKDKLIIHGSLGYNDAPFYLQDRFSSTTQKIRYRPNTNALLGLGLNYNWLGLGFSIQLPGHLRDQSLYGETNYFDLDLSFQLKQLYFTTDFHRYSGYSLTNYAALSNEAISETKINEKLRTYSTSINTYYLGNKDYSINAAKGIDGHYLELATSWFLKGTFNIHGITHEGASILPYAYFDHSTSVWKASRISAIDAGIVPGLALSHRVNQLHFSLMMGLGGVSQAKFYRYSSVFRGFIGLAPRYDFNFNVGYNVDKWFLQLKGNFDNKRIQFNNFRYKQHYYYLRVEYGYRF